MTRGNNVEKKMMTDLSWSVWRFLVSRWTGITAFSSLSSLVPNDSKILLNKSVYRTQFYKNDSTDLLIACVVASDCAIEFLICLRVFSSCANEASNWIRFSLADNILEFSFWNRYFTALPPNDIEKGKIEISHRSRKTWPAHPSPYRDFTIKT